MGNWSSKSKSASASVKDSSSSRPSVGGSYSSSSSNSFSNKTHTSPTYHGLTASSAGRTQRSPGGSYSAASSSLLKQPPSVTQRSPGGSYSAASSSLLKQPPSVISKVAKPASQYVKYSVNNYAPTIAHENERPQPQCINLPYDRLPDKFGLRICPQYSSKVGCRAVLCRRLHVCQYWVMKQCRFKKCNYDHSFTSSHNNAIINVFLKRRDFDMSTISETLQNNHRRERKLLMTDEHICIHNIMGKCTKKTCNLVHIKKTYQWEIHTADRRWIQFSHEQSNYLELLYSNPAHRIVELPQLSPRLSQHKDLKELRLLLSQAQSWNVDLEYMIISSGNLNYYVRRLSTPSDITCDFNRATRWIWYWQDDHQSWKPYTDGLMKFFILALSDHLEHHLHFKKKFILNVEIEGHSYDIDVHDQIQRNLETGKIRKLRRRPVCKKQDHEECSFDKLFLKSKSSDKTYMLLPLLPMTQEYINIEKMMTASLSNISIISVFQIRNDHLWKIYQNKKHHLLALYCNNTLQVNEQYLFHGTKHSVIEKICADNLDWRLFGSNVGNVYGRGTYFSNKASIADNYSETNALGQKAMFVLFVLVGTMTVGNSSMKIPPENPRTGRSFDTTCNYEFDSNIFVKYNRDEYYPAYIVKYFHN